MSRTLDKLMETENFCGFEEKLRNGNYLSIQDDVGMTALIWACSEGYTDIAQLLLENDAEDANSNIGLIIRESDSLILQFEDLQIGNDRNGENLGDISNYYDQNTTLCSHDHMECEYSR